MLGVESSAVKILVTGASGLVGRRLVACLLGNGMSVTAFVRRAESMAGVDGVDVAVGVVEDRAAVERAAAGCDAVVHLANASGVVDEARVQAVNVGGTENALAACAGKARRIVFISTISAMRARLGPYGRSKRLAEERVRTAGIPFVILRPSLVYGAKETGLVASLTRHLRSLPVMPVIGDGRIEIDPLHLDDLCAVIEACLLRDDVLGRTYDLLGPDRVTFDAFLRRLGGVLGVRRPLLHLPAPPLLLLARLLGRLMKDPPLTVDSVLGLTSPARVDREAAARDFPIAWTPLDVGLRVFDAR
jgi:nucleoside-diphosphate-sugar epimerase